MDKRDWTIVWLSLQLTFMGIAISRMAYDLGYARGRMDTLTAWDEDSDGYCLADSPPHKGQCHEGVQKHGNKKK